MASVLRLSVRLSVMLSVPSVLRLSVSLLHTPLGPILGRVEFCPGCPPFLTSTNANASVGPTQAMASPLSAGRHCEFVCRSVSLPQTLLPVLAMLAILGRVEFCPGCPPFLTSTNANASVGPTPAMASPPCIRRAHCEFVCHFDDAYTHSSVAYARQASYSWAG